MDLQSASWQQEEYTHLLTQFFLASLTPITPIYKNNSDDSYTGTQTPTLKAQFKTKKLNEACDRCYLLFHFHLFCCSDSGPLSIMSSTKILCFLMWWNRKQIKINDSMKIIVQMWKTSSIDYQSCLPCCTEYTARWREVTQCPLWPVY